MAANRRIDYPRRMNRLIGNRLRVRDFEGLAGFYGGQLGMTRVSAGPTGEIYGYGGIQSYLHFVPTATAPFAPGADDFYWKVGITLQNLDAAVAFLRTQGLSLPDPYQFRDIGYMTKLTDPNGLIIELLQQGFEGREDPLPAGHQIGGQKTGGHPIGAQATLAHITLRVTDLDAAKAFFETRLGMRLMSVQPVTDLGFCLYFYAWSAETLPHPDLKSVANREWLWRRPYTLIELQHLEAAPAPVQKAAPETCGFDGFTYLDQAEGRPVTLSLADLRHLS